MLYNLLYPLAEQLHLLNLLRYITFRSAGALLTSLIIALVIIPYLIKYLRKTFNKGQPIRDDGPQQHLSKKGTPTMGGIAIIASVIGSVLLWGDLNNYYLWVVIFVTIGYAILGFIDDYLKLAKYNTKGVPGRIKLLCQITIAIIAGLGIQSVADPSYNSHITLPLFKDLLINLGWLYIPFVIVVIVGASNAVNLTDGLDGLAIMPIIIAASCFALLAYLTGSLNFASYLQIQHVQGVAELAVFGAAMVGAGLGFLWYNSQPAEIFMGDVGSLACGGALGVMSVIVKHEVLLAIIGGLFVIEATSVIVQVYYFKFTKGKRFFKMAPIHHHFEKSGWSESKVVTRFWIIAVIFAIIGLSTLKIR
ncbi:MAG: phospho-N-acetylmuramoyl-pentapeptide-transferase [Rickettsiales bacterium]|jgi:phospho-N-acetylmuramoyl-pentapeptide-transferase|nr:phospho-N-acetylmuramoyl-pentapeptide-transferase [Rickettsiales bacterium]